MLLDNGSFHKSNALLIPENIVLVFLPPYSPELNPAEKVWWLLKREFVCKTFETIHELQIHLDEAIKKVISIETLKTLCSFEYLFYDL